MEAGGAALRSSGPASLPDLAARVAADSAGAVGFLTPAGGGFEPITHRRFGEQVVALAAHLIREGLAPGDRVLLQMETRYEWLVSDLAILSAGALTLPIYPNLPASQLTHPLLDAAPRMAIVSRPQLLARLLRAPGAERLERLFLLDDNPPKEAGDRLRSMRAVWDGPAPDPAELARIERIRASIPPHAAATILYTSGTSSTAKGVVLSHENILSNSRMALTSLDIRSTDRYLSVLPLAHVLERTVTYTMLAAGVTIAYGRGIESFARDAEALRPTVLLGVPRLFEQIHAGARAEARSRGALAAFLFRRAEASALRRAERGPAGTATAPRGLDALWDRLFFRPLREKLGGRVRLLVSGSAPLAMREAVFFRGAGLPLLEGYGLSEAGPIVSVNRPDAWKLGSVGRPLDGVEVRIAEDGEILVRSPSVMQGYLNMEAETQEALHGGWLHTGDLGRLDQDGFLSITGRKKDLIVTSGGKNIVPQVIEDRLRGRPFIQEAVVFGDRRPHLVALIVVDRTAAEARLREHHHGRPHGHAPGHASAARLDASTMPLVRSWIRKEIDEVNHELAPHERVRAFELLEEPPSLEAGTLTPTLKVRRAMLEAQHAERLATLYEGRRR